MPRSKKLSTYPRELSTIVEKVSLENRGFEVPIDSWREAAQMQGRFYAFRGAIKRELDEALKKGEDAVAIAQLKDLARWADDTVCWYDRLAGTEMVVRYINRSQTPEARKLRKMLEGGGRVEEGNVLDAEAQESFARLQATLAGDLE